MRTAKIKIYQIKYVGCKYAYMDYEYSMSHGFNLDDYEVVAEFSREVYEPNWRILETIFDLGNKGYIQAVCNDEFMHSISVSDIIELDGVKYYVDSFGFKEMK